MSSKTSTRFSVRSRSRSIKLEPTSYNLRPRKPVNYRRISIQSGDDLESHAPTLSLAQSSVSRARGRTPRSASQSRIPASMSRTSQSQPDSPRRRRAATRTSSTYSQSSAASARDDSEKGTGTESASDVDNVDDDQTSHATSYATASSTASKANARNRNVHFNNPPIVKQTLDKFPPKNLPNGPSSSTSGRTASIPQAVPAAVRQAQEKEKRHNWKIGVILCLSLPLTLLFYGYLFYYFFWPLPPVPALPARVLGAVRECAERYPRQKHVWQSLRVSLDDYLRPPLSQRSDFKRSFFDKNN